MFNNELLYSISKWQIYIVQVDFIFICNIPHYRDPSGKTLLMQFQSLIIRKFRKHIIRQTFKSVIITIIFYVAFNTRWYNSQFSPHNAITCGPLDTQCRLKVPQTELKSICSVPFVLTPQTSVPYVWMGSIVAENKSVAILGGSFPNLLNLHFMAYTELLVFEHRYE